MNDNLRVQTRFMAETLLAYLDGDNLAGRILHSGDYRVQLRRIIEQLAGNGGEQHTIPANEPYAIQLIVGPGAKEAVSSLSFVRKWLKNAANVTFCDPYFFMPPQSAFYDNEAAYVEAICGLIPSTARNVDVFCNGFKQTIRKEFTLRSKNGRRLRIFNTRDVHDRFVFREREAKAIGTSFGGFGNKLFGVFDLSSTDAEIVRTELDRLRRSNVGR